VGATARKVKAEAFVTEPPVVVTTTDTKPAARDGVVTVIVVDVADATVAVAPPKVTAVTVARLVPVRVTVCPPASEPVVGVTRVSVGTPTNVNAFVLVTEPPGVVTTTDTVPAVFAGVRTFTESAVEDTTVPAVPPNVTAVAPARLVPETVISVLPRIGPLTAESDDIVGPSTNVKASLFVAEPVGPETVSDTIPAERAGVTTTTLVAAFDEIVALVSPKETVEMLARFVPVIVTDFPPAILPAVVEIELTVGGAR